jgi:hypothetical protein
MIQNTEIPKAVAENILEGLKQVEAFEADIDCAK